MNCVRATVRHSGKEGNAEEDVGRALVELAGKAAVGHIELEEAVTGRQCHLVDQRRVPGRDDVAARVRVCLDALDELCHLVDMPAVIIRPGAPLGTIDGTEVAIFVGPLIPDADAVFLQVADIRIALQEPEQLVNDRLQMQALRRDDWKTFRQIKAHLVTEHGAGAGSRAVTAIAAGFKNVAQKVVILVHGSIHRVVDDVILSLPEPRTNAVSWVFPVGAA